MNERKFAPAEPVALEPRAFGMMILMKEYVPTVEDRSGIAVLSIRGPMQQFRDPFCESYEFIVERVRETLRGAPRAVVLSISSPGGLVSGVFEASDSIRSLCAAARVPLYAYVDGAACSAAYAIACAADRIVAPLTASVGSIGVIAEYVDASAQLAAQGVSVRMIASGASKGDGNPKTLAQWPQLARAEEKVNELAELFFAFVARRRPTAAGAVRDLDAGVFLGAKAKALGLIDDVQTLDDLIAAINSGAANSNDEPAVAQGADMSKAYEDAIAALRKAAESDDEKEAKRARRMLAAELDDEDDKPKKDDEDPKGEDDKPKKDDEDPKGEDAKASAPAASSKGVDAQIEALVEEKFRAREEALERAQLIASRTDFDDATKALLAVAPIETVRSYVAKAPRRALNPAAAASVTGTRGEGQGESVADESDPELIAIDRAMGLINAAAPKAQRRGNVLYMGRAPDKE